MRRAAGVLALLAAAVAVGTTIAGQIQRGEAVSAMSSIAQAEVVSTVLTGVALLFLICFAPLRGRRADRAPGSVKIAQLEVAATTDNLTGLGNHRLFHHDLSIEIQRRTTAGTHFTLMAIDLDGLKKINDADGHQAGDVYIRRVSEAVRGAVGNEGTVYRTGGDEFMVLLPGQRNWHGLTLAQKINEATRAAVGRRAVSIGLAESTGTESRQAIIHQADLALYEAKRTKLSALTYHPGLAPASSISVDGPSHHQKTLAAALARAVDAKDVGTRSHSETVSELCVGIGQRLGLSGDGLERLRLAGLLHDVGKIGVPDAILQKAAALAPDELDEMRQHVHVGHGILISAEMAVEAEWVLHHHERSDGGGYPAGFHAADIPQQSKIIAVADAFEAMTGVRPYRDSITTAEALDELRRNIGTQFDGDAVVALADVVDSAATEAVFERLPSAPIRTPTAVVGRPLAA